MTERAQTNLDFAIGVSILLVTIVAAMTFVPGLFETVDDGRADADQVASNRIASALVEEQLGHESQPARIDADCTRALFSGNSDDDADVHYCGHGEDDPEDNLGAVGTRNVNVAVEDGDGDRVCWDGGDGELQSEDCESGDLRFELGGQPTSGSEIAVTRRPVSIDGFHATVVVRAW